jgi:hypothetical protein
MRNEWIIKTNWGVERSSARLLKNSSVRYLEIIRVYSRSFVVSQSKQPERFTIKV